MVYFAAIRSSSDIQLNHRWGGCAIGSIRLILWATTLATGLLGDLKTLVYAIKSVFYFDAIIESTVQPCTAKLEYFVPSTACSKAISR